MNAAASVQPAAESQSAAGDDEAVQAAIALARARAQSRVSSRCVQHVWPMRLSHRLTPTPQGLGDTLSRPPRTG